MCDWKYESVVLVKWVQFLPAERERQKSIAFIEKLNGLQVLKPACTYCSGNILHEEVQFVCTARSRGLTGVVENRHFC